MNKKAAINREMSAAKAAAGLTYMGGRLNPETVAERLAEIPKDTRSLTQRLMGDPIPNDPRRHWRHA